MKFAVGASQFMETTNGVYAIYDKGTGALQSKISATAAGVDYGQRFFWRKTVPGAQIEALLERGFAHSLERPSTR